MLRRALLLFTVIPMTSMMAESPKLEEIPAYSLGIDALSGQLWVVAAAHFEDALKTKDLAAAPQDEPQAAATTSRDPSAHHSSARNNPVHGRPATLRRQRATDE